MDSCFIQNQFLRADFVSKGAELRRLRILHGADLLWDGDPEVWGRTSPTLFPIIGRVPEDRIRVDGEAYPMHQHGFARDLDWSLVKLTREDCVWSLKDTARTREQFPFPFELRVGYRVFGTELRVAYEVRNPGPAPLRASLGAHPAFRWPLTADAREEHRLEFERDETAPVRRVAKGLLAQDSIPSPVVKGLLPLRDDLFRSDALVFDQVQSRSLRYISEEGSGLEIAWAGFNSLALWTIPGADFLCIEPWAGYQTPEGFDGEFREKPGLFTVEPERSQHFGWCARVILPD